MALSVLRLRTFLVHTHVGYRISHMGYSESMELYHVLNRGVDERAIFTNTADYARFVHDLYEFNDVEPAPEFHRRDSRQSNVGYAISNIRERLVEIHGWCLMKNHYHLLLSECVENGLPLFLRKIGIGYTHYFNQTHERSGVLFQGRSKRVLVERQAHFLYILHYLHLNPLDYLKGAEAWRERSKTGVTSAAEALKYLETYRWSSYLDYAGKKNFPSLITKDLFEGRPGEYANDLRAYLKDAEGLTVALGRLALE